MARWQRGSRRAAAGLVATAVSLAGAGPLVAAQADGGKGPVERAFEARGAQSAEAESALLDEELDRMIAALADDSPDARRAAAGALVALGPDGIDAIARKLAALRRGTDDGAASLLHSVRDRIARDRGFDLLDFLVAAAPAPAARRALATDCMLRSLARAGTTAAARQLVGAASDLAGTLRPELARLLRGMGERAIPALIASRRDGAPEIRSWGAGLLSALVPHPPGDALVTRDDRLLGDILRAYGDVSDMAALPAVLSLANSDRAQVRAAAREATLAYGQDALWRLREAYAVLLAEPAPEGVTAAELAKSLFEAYDRYRLHDVYAMVDRGVALEGAGDAAQAVAVFDEVLAREPLVDRRGEMVPAYVDRARALEPVDPGAARACLRKALRLDERGPRAAHVRSELDRLEGEALAARGLDDATLFEQALAIEPQNQAARADLQRLRGDVRPAKPAHWRYLASGAVLLLAIAGIVVFGRRRGR